MAASPFISLLLRVSSPYTVLGQILDPLGVQELSYDVGRLDVVDRPDVLHSVKGTV